MPLRRPSPRLPILSVSLVLGAACTDVVDRDEVSLSAQGIHTLSVRDLPGDLRVKGVEGLETIEAVVKLKEWDDDEENDTGDTGFYADEPEIEIDYEEQFEVLLSNAGGGVAELIVLSGLPMEDYWVVAKIKVPTDVAVSASLIEDDVTLKNVGGADVLDGSGTVEILGSSGPVTVSDDSGSLKVTDVVGNVNIVDSSGRVVVKHVEGDVEIRDGKGAIKVKDVTGKVTIWDTQGKQTIKDVGETEIHDPEG